VLPAALTVVLVIHDLPFGLLPRTLRCSARVCSFVVGLRVVVWVAPPPFLPLLRFGLLLFTGLPSAILPVADLRSGLLPSCYRHPSFRATYVSFRLYSFSRLGCCAALYHWVRIPFTGFTFTFSLLFSCRLRLFAVGVLFVLRSGLRF